MKLHCKSHFDPEDVDCAIYNGAIATELLIWDEALMAHSHNILAVDRMMRDMTKNNTFFGNKIIIFCGDPRQTLPVIPKGSRSHIVNASMMKCPHIWDKSIKINSTVNMRVIRNGNNPDARQILCLIHFFKSLKMLLLQPYFGSYRGCNKLFFSNCL